MKKGERRRQQILERLADHVLAHGLQGSGLRAMGAAAGTSDRMLLHYFTDKEELLTETLTLVTQRLITLLESARADPMPFHRLLPHLSGVLEDARLQPYMRLWLELVTLAAGGKEPYRMVGQQICRTLLDWIAVALEVEREEDRQPLAALTLVIVEGFGMLDALGDEATRTAARAGLAGAISS
jgi:AcrR family transcriptional regulator